MNIKTSLRSLALVGVMATGMGLSFSGAAYADPPPWAAGGAGQHEEREHGFHERDHDRDHDRGPERHAMPRGGASMHFDDGRRDQIYAYMRETHRGHCPPGLAKKHNGCHAPRQSRKYHVGGVLPRTYRPVPPALMTRLGPPPQGAFYALVDNDVLLASEAGKKILDAVTLLSAIQ